MLGDSNMFNKTVVQNMLGRLGFIPTPVQQSTAKATKIMVDAGLELIYLPEDEMFFFLDQLSCCSGTTTINPRSGFHAEDIWAILGTIRAKKVFKLLNERNLHPMRYAH